MTKVISNNLKARIKLLRESNNYMQMLVNNKIKIPEKVITEHRQNLKICKELIKQEILKTPITDLLTTINR